MPWTSGLDLGQAHDYTALACCEQQDGPDPARPGQRCWHYACRVLARYPLGTPYTTVGEQEGIAQLVSKRFARPPLQGTALAVDYTGVGRAVLDILRGTGIPACLWPVTSTAGSVARQDGLDWHVPKRDLIGNLLRLLQSDRLRIAKALPLAPVLEAELAAFRVKQRPSGHESFEAHREGDHDDIVLALAVAVWVGEHSPSVRRGDVGHGRREAGERAPQGTFLGGSFRAPPGW